MVSKKYSVKSNLFDFIAENLLFQSLMLLIFNKLQNISSEFFHSMKYA